ncbi:MAG: hypothetical protein A2W90_12555 [Bacteroidetes bacterium GWF2_42_66]|nr:MAG: hypothetical protein A2W92_22870 [Bacteroidetes bacterium GWA2_42_15]OFY00058.1 MAG: hypothetical protein A2W89_17540 [Bacteroidetes bacterium GWE2_42_39]OFY40201.1 MAG: hypothetical protein A2W90_12555 [Bacteroidetes bacterium GWF2_42_66]HBL74032.1 hypothetical protein [Prolixibacteraceae bacterium]HCR89550.1 hypothetical protein [Prolixibacteraceae bacterium]
MALNKAQHTIEEIDGVRCSIVEKGATADRVAFLKQILERNGYEVKTKAEGETELLTIGVTNILFNPIVSVYGRSLKSLSGKRVTPAYWLQQSDKETEAEVNYWTFKA